MRAKTKKWVKFELEREAGLNVCLAGTFNHWTPQRISYISRKSYVVQLSLAPGRYEYKFVVGGEWIIDPLNPLTCPNDQGTLNSVIIVKEA